MEYQQSITQHRSPFLPFTSGDIEAVLYGYFPSGSHLGLAPLHSLSGIVCNPWEWNKENRYAENFPPSIPSIRTSCASSNDQLRETNIGASLINVLRKPETNRAGDSQRQADLPDNLAIRQLSMRGMAHVGVFCKSENIQAGTKFGPYSGRSILPADEERVDLRYSWEVFVDGQLSHLIDGSSDPQNWMKVVNCARHVSEQNATIVQEGTELFFVTSRNIHKGEELLVWYGSTYDKYFDLPLAMKTDREPIPRRRTFEVINEAEEATGTFPCDRCGKVFTYEYYLEKHLKFTKCVDQGDRQFPCPHCQRSFEKRDRLRIHVLHVHKRHRPHVCEVCDKRFSQSSSLNKHRRVHSGERPYKCPHCIKAFTASSILRTHLRQHSGEKPFKCRHCDKAFASHAAHDSHVRRKHIDQKPFVCYLCGKAFSQGNDLKSHMNIHMKEKPHECEDCGRRFSCASSRDRHRQQLVCQKNATATRNQKPLLPIMDNNNNNIASGL